jgi:Zn-dependent metalloprotease
MRLTALALVLAVAPAAANASPSAASATAHRTPAAAAAQHPAAGRFAQVRRAAEAQVAQWKTRAPQLDVNWRADLAGPAMILDTGERLDLGRAQEQGLTWAQNHAELWGITAADLQVLQLQTVAQRTTLRLTQTALVAGKRAPVLDRGLNLTLDAKGQLISVTADLLPVAQLASPRVAQSDAKKAAVKAALGARDDHSLPVERVQVCELAVIAGPSEAKLVWAADVVVQPLTDRRAVLVDAETGAVLSQRQTVLH